MGEQIEQPSDSIDLRNSPELLIVEVGIAPNICILDFMALELTRVLRSLELGFLSGHLLLEDRFEIGVLGALLLVLSVHVSFAHDASCRG